MDASAMLAPHTAAPLGGPRAAALGLGQALAPALTLCPSVPAAAAVGARGSTGALCIRPCLRQLVCHGSPGIVALGALILLQRVRLTSVALALKHIKSVEVLG